MPIEDIWALPIETNEAGWRGAKLAARRQPRPTLIPLPNWSGKQVHICILMGDHSIRRSG